MKVIITENQFENLIKVSILNEDNDYFNYDNISSAQKLAFYRDKAGYRPIKVKTPAPTPKYVELWMPKNINLLTQQTANSIKNGKWILMQSFAQWSFAIHWLKQNYPKLNKEYYRIIPKYE